MEQKITGIFSELGRRLALFGTDACTRDTVRRAALANPWFLPAEIERAARNIAECMLSANALQTWLSACSGIPVDKPKNVLIIMAGNIPFVGFHDLLCVLAAGHCAAVKPSSKDSMLMSYIVSELLGIAPGLPVSVYAGSETPDAVIAMGGDNTAMALRERYREIPVLLRGSRWSTAVLDGTETREELAGLSGDIMSYSGLGCRNVSLVFVPRNYDIHTLQNVLSANAAEMNPKYLNNYRQVKALLELNGQAFVDCGINVLVEGCEFPTTVSRINYSFYDNPSEAADWISAHDGEIQCVAGKIAHPRATCFGETQRPSLTDYPDGRDTMEFLAGI